MSCANLAQRAGIALVFSAVALLPSSAHAAYNFAGQTFDSFEEYSVYVAAYLVVWRELHRGPSSVQPTEQTSREPSATTTEATSSHPIDVTTRYAQNIAAHSATLEGRVTHDGNAYAEVWFQYGTSPYKLSSSTVHETRERRDLSNRFDQKLLDLTHDMTYYFRAVGTNPDGLLSYGTVRSFRTPVDPRIDRSAVRISTARANNLDENRATLHARIDFRSETYARIWFEYGDEEDELFERTPRATIRVGDGSEYERTVRGLEDEYRYYFRAVAQDPQGSLSYGRTYSFTTRRDIPNEQPAVTTERAEAITAHTAVLKGAIDMNDERDGVAFLAYGEDRDDIAEIPIRYDRFSRIREYGDDRQVILLDDDLDRYDEYSVKISGLDLDTEHYFAFGVAYENSDDVVLLGRVLRFTTRR